MEEVKLAIKPYYQRKDINKDEYKDILRKAVHKVSLSIHTPSTELNLHVYLSTFLTFVFVLYLQKYLIVFSLCIYIIFLLYYNLERNIILRVVTRI